MPPDYCFSDSVPASKKQRRLRSKSPGLDSELDELLGKIEKHWRDSGHRNLRGLVRKGDDEDGLVAESTWFSWRKGLSTPDYVQLRDVARGVGLDLGLPRDCAGSESRIGNGAFTGGLTLKSETADVVKMMEGAPDDLRAAIKDRVIEMVMGRLADPQDADADQDRPRLRK